MMIIHLVLDETELDWKNCISFFQAQSNQMSPTKAISHQYVTNSLIGTFAMRIMNDHHIFPHHVHLIECWRYRCFGQTLVKPSLSIHQDNDIHPTISVFTCIIYIRKDKTVRGGLLQFYDTSQKQIIHVFEPHERHILIFPGNLYHSVTPLHGFGIRDCIVVLCSMHS